MWKEQSMQNNNTRPLALGLTILGGLIRIVQRWNFAPVGGLSLFAGARLRGWQAWATPLILMAITDPLVGGYSRSTPFIYASFLITVWIGTRLRNTEKPLAIGAAAFAGSLQFFLITNAATWYFGTMYPHTFSGLITCYTVAIPFYGRTLASDLFYSGLLFGLHSWVSRTQIGRSVAPAECPALSR
jgi:hypothetical protein